MIPKIKFVQKLMTCYLPQWSYHKWARTFIGVSNSFKHLTKNLYLWKVPWRLKLRNIETEWRQNQRVWQFCFIFFAIIFFRLFDKKIHYVELTATLTYTLIFCINFKELSELNQIYFKIINNLGLIPVCLHILATTYDICINF